MRVYANRSKTLVQLGSYIMTKHIITEQTLMNEQSVPSSEITRLAFSGFAHFTALQVRNRMVKALDLHLNRLHKASIELLVKQYQIGLYDLTFERR